MVEVFFRVAAFKVAAFKVAAALLRSAHSSFSSFVVIQQPFQLSMSRRKKDASSVLLECIVEAILVHVFFFVL